MILRQYIREIMPLFSVYEASFICCFQKQTKLWFSWFLLCFGTFRRFPSHRDKGLVLLWCIFCIIYENRQSRWKLHCFRCFCCERFLSFFLPNLSVFTSQACGISKLSSDPCIIDNWSADQTIQWHKLIVIRNWLENSDPSRSAAFHSISPHGGVRRWHYLLFIDPPSPSAIKHFSQFTCFSPKEAYFQKICQSSFHHKTPLAMRPIITFHRE